MLQKSSTQNEIKNPTSHLISIYVCVHVSVYANMLRITDTAKWAVWTRTWPFACPWSVRQKKKKSWDTIPQGHGRLAYVASSRLSIGRLKASYRFLSFSLSQSQFLSLQCSLPSPNPSHQHRSLTHQPLSAIDLLSLCQIDDPSTPSRLSTKGLALFLTHPCLSAFLQ